MPVPSSLPSCSHLSIFHYNVHSNWGILVIIVVVVIVVIIVRLIVVSGGWANWLSSCALSPPPPPPSLPPTIVYCCCRHIFWAAQTMSASTLLEVGEPKLNPTLALLPLSQLFNKPSTASILSGKIVASYLVSEVHRSWPVCTVAPLDATTALALGQLDNKRKGFFSIFFAEQRQQRAEAAASLSWIEEMLTSSCC